MARGHPVLERLVSSLSFHSSAVLDRSRADLWGLWGYEKYRDVVSRTLPLYHCHTRSSRITLPCCRTPLAVLI
jgi:hypothetical protein